LAWRAFLQRHHRSLRVELDNAIALRVDHRITQEDSTLFQFRRALQQSRRPIPEENIVTQSQPSRIAPDELAPDDEGLGQSVR
jgi:hypothetical protein